MPNYAVNPNFTGYAGLTWPQSLEVYYAIQNGTLLPSYTPPEIAKQEEERRRQQQQQQQQSYAYDGGRRMRYKSTRRRGKTNRRRGKTHRRRHRKH